MGDIDRYKTTDSLNAVKVGVLSLKLNEFNKLRAKDAEEIKKLKVVNRELNSINKIQLETITKFSTPIIDSIIITNHIVDTIKCVRLINNYLTMVGCFEGNLFNGTIKTRDSLLITVDTDYKRFLGFLWRTKKVKDRAVNVVSKNSLTEILDVEYIEIRK